MNSQPCQVSPILAVLHRLTGIRNKEALPLLEREGLCQFCHLYQDQRNFTDTPDQLLFQELLVLMKSEWLKDDWLLTRCQETTEAEEDRGEVYVHAALMSLRLLLRDEGLQQMLLSQPDTLWSTLAHFLAYLVTRHFSSTITPTLHTSSSSLLQELTNILQKVSNNELYREQLVECDIHCLLVQLLWSQDLVALQCSLCSLINLCKTERVCAVVSSLDMVVPLLHMINSYDAISQHLAADLLLLLSQQSSFKQQIRNYDSLPACLRILHSEDQYLLHRGVGVVERLAEATHLQEEIRLLGGISLLLNILKQHVLTDGLTGHAQEKMVSLRAVCYSALTQLLLDDQNAQLIVQNNGAFLIACNILPPKQNIHAGLQENLQCYALRALRYLFSMERNRRVFKKLFPPELFVAFIDIGHYTSSLSAYSQLVHTINALSESELAVMCSCIEAMDHEHSLLFSIAGYVVLELLGAGAFGSVYKVRKQSSGMFYALKEIRGSQPTMGPTLEEHSTSLKRLFNEVAITREQLRHPNIVHYHTCFQEGNHLYIVMELLEGAPLSEHIMSMEEKGFKFSEERLWRIFTQLVLALRYLHKERKVVHRDLSPANLMLGEDDKLTITDFGLAKLKQMEFSVMKSVVGTMLYWCPELVQSEPYTEKVDVWAAGCILYQMATLQPPFQSNNLLALARKIAEVDYAPLPAGAYSSLVCEVVAKCLTADPTLRPDTIQLGAQLSGLMMAQMDSLSVSKETLERRLAKERQRTIRHYHRALTIERRYHQLLSSSTPSFSIIEDLGHTSSECMPSSHARRKLSTAFASIQQNRKLQLSSDSDSHKDPSSGITLNRMHGSDVLNHLQDLHQNSKQSLFMVSTSEEAALYRLPSNWEQPTSPQVILRGFGRPNPLICHTSSSITSELHNQSSEDSLASSHAQQNFRKKSSVPLPGTTWNSAPTINGGTVSLSPLAIGCKSRTSSASSTLSISPKHLREVSDPILHLLTPLHKLIFLSQLPPNPVPSARQMLVHFYKKHIFSHQSSPSELKAVMYQLANGNGNTVRVFDESETGWIGGGNLVQRALGEIRDGGVAMGREAEDGVVTYEILQQMIEGLAVEHGYYHMHSH